MKSNFKERYVKALDESGKSAAQISKNTGISKGTLSHYAKGDYIASQANLALLAMEFNVAIGWLMGYDVPKEPQNVGEPQISEVVNTITERAELFSLFTIIKNMPTDKIIQLSKIAEALK